MVSEDRKNIIWLSFKEDYYFENNNLFLSPISPISPISPKQNLIIFVFLLRVETCGRESIISLNP